MSIFKWLKCIENIKNQSWIIEYLSANDENSINEIDKLEIKHKIN